MKAIHFLTVFTPAIFALLLSCKKEVADGGNQPPVADAGPDTTYYWPYPVELNGSGTDADGSIFRYEWSVLLSVNYFFGDNDMNRISNVYSAKTTVQNLNPGKHAFLLIVTDDKGATGKDWVTINVIDTLTKSGKEYVHQDVVWQSDNDLFFNSYIDYSFLSVSDKLLYYYPGKNMEVWIKPQSASTWQPVLKANSIIPSNVFEYSVGAGILTIRRLYYPLDNLDGTKGSIKVRFL